MSVLPVPLTGHDSDAGYWWELQLGASRESDAAVLEASWDAVRRAP